MFRMISCCVSVLIAAILFAACPVLAEETVTVGFGSLKIGGIYQSHYAWYESDSIASQFKTHRARLLLSGTLIPDKVKFLVQADAVQNPYLLDTKLMMYHIPNTEMTIGRFVPNFTLYMPQSTAKLDFINYPVTTTQYAMWRQTGIQFKTSFDALSLCYGVFNGYDTEAGSVVLKGNDWGDKNDAKDFLLSADYKVADGFKIGAFGWWGKPYDSDADQDFDVSRYGFNFEWRKATYHIAGEYVMGSNEYTSGVEIDSNALMAQGGIHLNPSWEILARYDMSDSDTDVDDNGNNWLTTGVNYSLAGINTKIFFNYIFKWEEGDEIDNDEFVVQAQYSF